MKRIKSEDVTFIGDVVQYKGIPFSGILLSEDETTQTKIEIEILDGLKNGSANFFDYQGVLHMQKNYINGIKHGLEFILHANGKKIKESQYNKGKHIKSIHFNKEGEEIKGLFWFSGNISEDKLKIRKYYMTNRYCFSPNLLWLDPVPASIFYYLVKCLHSTCNYELSRGGGGILAMELSRDEKTYIKHDLKFKDLKSRKNLEEKILMFKKYFFKDYKMIFNDNTLDDVIELSKYKILIDPWTFSSSIEKEIQEQRLLPSELFKNKYLDISQSFSKDYKDWIILDKSVKPMGILFDSETKQECIDWIKFCEE
jgi:hypothetical protein